MFGRFFGNPQEETKEAPKLDPMQLFDQLNDTLNVTEKRCKYLLIKTKECREEALKAKKAGDVRTALKWMLRMKVLKEDLAKLNAQ